MAEDEPEDDVLFERLQDAASGDNAARQLRRRYDLLRGEYEQLLDRLGQLEARLGGAAEPEAPSAEVREEAFNATLTEGLLQPLVRLRDEYVTALAGMQGLVRGLESLAAGAFKGQRGATAAAVAPPPVPVREEVPRHPRTVQVDVKGRGVGWLLAFQERLAGLAGVARVSIHAIDAERASLVVELDDGER